MDAEFLRRSCPSLRLVTPCSPEVPNDNMKILVLGDGDFSFSLAFHRRYNILFTTSTLETEEEVIQKYPCSREALHFLRHAGVLVYPNVDATKLCSESRLIGKLFSHIIFNFPHVGGKSNIKKNRELLRGFFTSASKFLSKAGKILVTLCNGQGGTEADNPRRAWCDSWQVTSQAAHGDLILQSVQLFDGEHLFQNYTSTGYRSQNKKFHTEQAVVHSFIKSIVLAEPGLDYAQRAEQYLQHLDEHHPFFLLVRSISDSWSLREARRLIIPVSPNNLAIGCTVDFVWTSGYASLPPIYYTPKHTLFMVRDQLQLSGPTDDCIVGMVTVAKISVDVTLLARLLLDFPDSSLLWSADRRTFMNVEICRLRKCVYEAKPYTPVSIYPPEYRHDISFWLSSTFDAQSFYELVFRCCGHLVKCIELIDSYTGDGGKVSNCYRLVFQSLNTSLSYDQSYNYYQYLRKQVELTMGVQLR